MSRRLRPLAAGIVLLFLMIGVPAVLVLLAGWPLPRSVPAVGNVVDMIRQGNIPAEAVIKTIAVVVWLAWAQLVWSVLWETIVNVPRLTAGRTWRPPPLVVSPVGHAAARLVSAILAASIISATTPGIASALSTPSGLGDHIERTTVDAGATTGEVTDDPGFTSRLTWRVAPGDDLWSIAEQALGDGSHVDRIVELNPGVTARTLSVGMLLELPSGSMTRGGAQPASTPATDETASDPVQGPDASSDDADSPTGRYVVQPNDGMWNVAEALLGDGARHVEMRQLALGQEVAPGVVFDSDAVEIHPGWVFSAEPVETDTSASADGAETYVVEDGDTLSDIAAAELGDESDWTSIWELNAHDDMGGGRTFDDPDLIVPGWELDLPATVGADAAGTDPADHDGETAGPEATETVPIDETDDTPAVDLVPERSEPTDIPVEEPLDESAEATDAAPDFPAADAGAQDEAVTPVGPSTSVPTTTSTTASTTTTTTEPTGGWSADAPTDQEFRSVDAPRAPSPIRMEHAALLAAGVLTLVGVRRRRALRAALPHARVPAPPPEVSATERRFRTIDVGERAARVDIAARSAAHAIMGTGTRIGTIRIAKDGEILLRLTAGATLPAPWEGSGAGWTLPAAIPIEMLGDDSRRVGQPCLALVTIGLDHHDRDVLLDLEAADATIIAAQPDQADAVVRAIGTSLATSLNAETLHLITSSLGSSFLLDHPNIHVERNVATSLATARSLVGSTKKNEQSSFDLRARRTGGDTWEPAVLLFSHDDDAGAAVGNDETVVLGDRVALVASSSTTPVRPHLAGARIVAHADGWTLDAFDEQIDISPIGVSDDDVAAVVQILDDAARPIEPTPMIEPDISEHLADPITPLPHDIVVHLMGGVEITDAEGTRGTFERSKTVELIAWLATHRERATRSGARTALWELDVRDATFANVVSEARRGLGRLTPPPAGEEWLARTLNESLPLHPRVVTDADLIEQRVAHAELAPPAHAIDVLKPAVAMIRGLPFAGTSYLWPDADGITSNLVLLATTAACELAGHALSMGDTNLVFWATGQGLKVLPGHEELIGFRMRAHARAGDLAGVRSEWESYERVITGDAWSDGEPAPKLLDLRRALLTPTS